jgi:hypothetical protein
MKLLIAATQSKMRIAMAIANSQSTLTEKTLSKFWTKGGKEKKWTWWGSNPRPDKLMIDFLHA